MKHITRARRTLKIHHESELCANEVRDGRGTGPPASCRHVRRRVKQPARNSDEVLLPLVIPDYCRIGWWKTFGESRRFRLSRQRFSRNGRPSALSRHAHPRHGRETD